MCDPAETEAATRWCATQERGPVYLRLGKAGEPDFTSKLREPWEFGKLRQLRPGGDVCILTYGPIVKRAMAIADCFEASGKRTAVHSVHTLKPLDRDVLIRILLSYPHVVVIEECAPNGSLAMRVRELGSITGAKARLDTFTLQDAFIHCYGSHDDILDAHGLATAKICTKLNLT
jgi:transketolase